MNRRTFLFQSTALAAGAMIFPTACARNSNSKSTDMMAPGLQVYTIREALAEDFQGSMQRIADLGYVNIELFAYGDGQYFGNSIPEVKTMMSDMGLQVKSSHVATGWTSPDAVGTMTNNWEQTVQDAAELGQDYIVLAYLTEEERQSMDDYKKVAELLNSCGETAKNAGLQMAYHNHAFEFETMDDQVPYDLLLSECDEDLVKFELDLYWTRRAGVDPIAYFEKHSGRFPLWHVKDMAAGEDQFFAAVGEGVIDWENMFSHAETAGLDYYFVEQDATRSGEPFKEIEKSIGYLENIL
ncbi:sugar phosphate isomerase/epimerase [Balneolaceae bacterium YR4-1]|uniref:Sugar phosphate isomerase/epimerase n=1 Tax=Halalkalibaculum roseum TaxID=2709311 RepID=A0A6M1SQ08_9BACT|nr:sugar phosphate isomerase/epimerase [Halalkalibaculum roseum]NGP77451.1 sugar phosphate isomerase/epimerase [Halalkalibaculum roseum]